MPATVVMTGLLATPATPWEPPERIDPLAVAPAKTISIPDVKMVVEIVVAPERADNTPLVLPCSPEAVAPLDSTSMPACVSDCALPPFETVTGPPTLTEAALNTPPDWTRANPPPET